MSRIEWNRYRKWVGTCKKKKPLLNQWKNKWMNKWKQFWEELPIKHITETPMFCWSLLTPQAYGKISKYKIFPWLFPFPESSEHFSVSCDSSFHRIRKPKLPSFIAGTTSSQGASPRSELLAGLMLTLLPLENLCENEIYQEMRTFKNGR